MGKFTTIPLKIETKEKLKNIGHKGETYDELVLALLEIAKKSIFFERQKEILDREEFVDLAEI